MKHPTLRTLATIAHAERLTRRRFLKRIGMGMGMGALALSWTLPGRPRPAIAQGITQAKAKRPDEASIPTELLEQSGFVYISPLLRDGKESRCHAEVWYAWIDDSIVITVAKDRWKATALARGLNGARIWVGDHGRWKARLGGRNENFLTAPSFYATASRVEDSQMIERLLTVYAKKYPDEIDRWRDRMRSGNADGSRILIRYRPKLGAGD